MIGIIYNEQKKGSKDLYDYIINWYKDKGKVVISKIEDLTEECEFIVVLGGDGTILRTANIIQPKTIPILGINLGRLGFLTSVEKENLDFYLEKSLDDDNYKIEKRIMLDVEILNNGEVIYKDIALNDVVFSRNYLEGMLGFLVKVSDVSVDEFFADGYIISTPTGSTAYSLSAGGPILTPEMDVILLTPICPHTLYARPIVVQGSEEIDVILISAGRKSIISVDGQRHYKLNNKSSVKIIKSKVITKTIRFKDRVFFKVLGDKIGKRK
ncbi:MAG: NAD(+)/NADH kinase [Firmicutes bacterium]|nr:NAD(+)/NADH kinase [Bacillota bacterium]